MQNLNKQPQIYIDELYNTIEHHAKLYYEQDNPEISDSEYDELVRQLKKLEAEYPEYVRENFLTRGVGGQANKLFSKVTHAIPMLSLDNVFDFDELANFFNRLSKNQGDNGFTCEMKIDGLAISLIYEDGIFIQGATRGNGYEGEDVTENLRMIKNLPLELKNFPSGRVELRGEVLMTLDNFNALNQKREAAGEIKFANPRNAAAGTLRQLNKNIVAERNLSVFIYYLVDAQKYGLTKQFDVLKWLSEKNLPVQSAYSYCENLSDVEKFITHWQNERANLNYETDGVVIKLDDLTQWQNIGTTSHAPKWAAAFKYPPEEALTKLLDIKISVGRTGVLTPVAILEPVKISGSTVQRASLHNFDEIARKNIMLGDYVRVRKAAEIIPEIIAVDISKRTGGEKIFNMPELCPACNNKIIHVEGDTAYRCPNKNSCPAQLRESLKYFASRQCMNIKGLGDSLCDDLIKSHSIEKITDLYKLNIMNFTSLDRIGIKTAQKILDNIENSKSRPLSAFIAALGIPEIGINTAELLVNKFGTLENICAASLNEIMTIDGIGNIVAGNVFEFFRQPENLDMLEEFKYYGVPADNEFEDQNANKNSDLAGKIFVLTGALTFTRAEAESLIKNSGGKISESVSKKTNYLIAGDKPGSKLLKAQELGVTVLNEQEFINLLGGK